MTVEAIAAAVAEAEHGDPDDRLAAFVGVLVRTLMSPAATSWPLRVVAREMVNPASATDDLRDKGMYPAGRLMRTVVSEATGLPEDHPAVARTCLSVAAPLFMLLICDRPTLDMLFPGLGGEAADADALTAHLVRFIRAGLAALPISAPDA